MAKKEHTTADKETPLMRQYNGVKAKYPNALVLFRVGDFYETFGTDAVLTSQVLGIVLTKRANGAASHIELAGFPHHSLDSYLPRLVRAGHRVAICDQLEDPKLTKTIVKRGVTELVSPGVAYNDKILDHKSSNYLAAIFFDHTEIGVAFIDISTGEFMVAQGNTEYIDKLLQGLKPAEILISKAQKKQFAETYGNDWYSNTQDEWIYTYDFGLEKLLKHFQTHSLKGFGVDELQLAIIAAGACLQYINDNQHVQISHISSINRLTEDHYVWLDKFTIRNLEIVSSQQEKGTALIDILDRTITPMGSRLLKKWMVLPLKNLEAINKRLQVVDYFYQQPQALKAVTDLLKQSGDLERLVSKIALNRINPRELYQLHIALQIIGPLKTLLTHSNEPELLNLAERLNICESLVSKIGATLMPEPPMAVNKGNVIASGISTELDELRTISYNGKDFLMQMQQREIANTGITSLKISYNNVFGYYIEVTHAHKNKVPAEWIRKQTLTNAERYITEELKVYEEKILGAEEKILRLEEQLYANLVSDTMAFIAPVQINAQVIAQLDCLLSFAFVAKQNAYNKPLLNDGHDIYLKACRHPVIEKMLPADENYIANDITLSKEGTQVMILTGPNMSGKSALLRQTALAVLMAQVGSFVACDAAEIGLVDKIYTRVGASDNLSGGESTFMVEMLETASILNNLSERSLIILDEIGRGTSTYDGVSLAWSIAEFLNHHATKPKTLFATHYHELNELESHCKGIENFHISLKEIGNKIIFLRKLLRGGSEHSFGIHVARMAGIPKEVLDRSNEILTQLEQQRGTMDIQQTMKDIGQNKMQLSMFTLDDPLLTRINEELRKIDINALTPVEALMKLNYLKQLMEKV